MRTFSVTRSSLVSIQVDRGDQLSRDFCAINNEPDSIAFRREKNSASASNYRV